MIQQTDEDRRFEFGKNWARFLEVLDDARVEEAKWSLAEMLEVEDLDGLSFLDVGSGSGLFSLAARRLGARVHSFDVDPHSVACTKELRRRFYTSDEAWAVEAGSVLDAGYLKTLGTYDVVYSWGVLHHTGDMWTAFENVVSLVGPNGRLFIAIYNDQSWKSRVWTRIKRTYVGLPRALRFLIVVPAFFLLWGPRIVVDGLTGNPFRTWRRYSKNRGMAPWRDVVDWVGGYPFEVATPEEIFEFFHRRGFVLVKMKTVGGRLGNNQFVFQRESPLDSGAP
jgi:2-polyprenyl-6-hydroxyphenyl methylase/3-demethylubiquinone-9 3-methyltransferase